jgi:glycosyltransferase involved in cell wall biosynthesis
MVFVGDGEMSDSLQVLAAELGLGARCAFIGRVPHEQVERYLSIIDITPFPRKPLPVCEMVSPLKPLESMASGIAVLVSDVQALAEMVGDDERGLTFAKGSVEALAERLQQLIEDEDLRARLVERGDQWVRAERSWTVVAGRVKTAYQALL